VYISTDCVLTLNLRPIPDSLGTKIERLSQLIGIGGIQPNQSVNSQSA
jgi:hypothetical protein